jgi:hypothetical protein
MDLKAHASRRPPPVSAAPAAVNLEIARRYLLLARQLAEVGAEWPMALDDATRRRLKSALGLEI